MLTRLLRAFARSIPVWLSLAVLAGALLVQATEPAFKVRLRNHAFDAFQRLQPREVLAAPVCYVDLDDETLARFGQWPWPRNRLAELVDRLIELGAAAVVFDVVFAEPDRTSPATVLEPWTGDPEIARLARTLPDHDQSFAASLTRLPAVIGFAPQAGAAGSRPPELRAGFALLGGDAPPPVPSFSGWVASLEPLEAAAAGVGALSVDLDDDAVLRRLALLVALDGQLYPTLTAEAVRLARGASQYLVRSGGSRLGGGRGLDAVRIGDLTVETDPGGRIWLHFAPPTDERRIPVWQVLEGEPASAGVAGKMVYFGTSAIGLQDFWTSPLGDRLPGVEVHVQAFEQLLASTYLVRPGGAVALEVLTLAVIGLLLIALTLRLGAVWSAVVGATAVAAIWIACFVAFSQHRLLFDPAFPSLAAISIFTVCLVSRGLETERERRWIQGAFSRYISPNLVDHLIRHRDELHLGGERRECSFVFSDLEGFTTLVESSPPELIVRLLNEYLDGLTRIALKHEGTLDRIVGDSVAVTFSAPVEQRDHAERALACAIAFESFSLRFQERMRKQGIEVGRTRIGVHTGPVTVGNFGGERFVDYRALGDPINTAARLESANRHLGIYLCVSGDTVARCPDFRGRPVGRLLLKGKRELIEAWQPLDGDPAAAEHSAAYLAAYDLMRQGDPGASEAFAELARRSPDDPLVRLHLERLRRGESGVRVELAEK